MGQIRKCNLVFFSAGLQGQTLNDLAEGSPSMITLYLGSGVQNGQAPANASRTPFTYWLYFLERARHAKVAGSVIPEITRDLFIFHLLFLSVG
jgi:hypothetical protein